MIYDRERETREAIQAGERALQSLRDAKAHLHSAGNWGILDILGGRGLTALMKHNRVRDAGRCLEDAERDLSVFRRELGDVRELDIHIPELLVFADFFFDGPLVDVMVQSRIREAEGRVEEASRRTEEVLRELRKMI
ncbi:MAG: hypothetical protein IJ083_17480 [Clostridia bacterium]|nr:hypothetical protein [Clostridia bacterium]